jgi:hypothetical protein
VNRVVTGLTDSAAADLARAEGLIDQALAASPRSAYAHFVKGEVLRAQHRFERRCLFEHRPHEGRRVESSGAEDSRLVRNHFIRRPAQDRGAGGMSGAHALAAIAWRRYT